MPSRSDGASAASCVRDGGKRVAVGYDGRLHSPELEAQLVAGLRTCGLDVVRIGLCATPMLYFAAYDQEADGAVMVTGSHNPPDYNGFKMMIGKKPFFGAQIQQIGRMAARGRRGARDAWQRPRRRYLGALCRPCAARLGRRGPRAEGDMGSGQWFGRPDREGADRAPAGDPLRDQRRCGRHISEPPSRPDRGKEPRAADRRGGAREGRPRHRLRRRWRPHRRGRRRGPHPVRRPAADRAGARRAEGASPAAPSSPM